MKQAMLLVLVGFGCTVAVAQSTPPIALSIAISTDRVPVGQKPWVGLTIKNLTNEEISYPDDQVYVQGDNGEPPATPWQRQRRNRQLSGGYRPSIQPGDSFTMRYDLSAFYELSKPGKYAVYIEVMAAIHATAWKGDWMRSPSAHFEIISPSLAGAQVSGIDDCSSCLSALVEWQVEWQNRATAEIMESFWKRLPPLPLPSPLSPPRRNR